MALIACAGTAGVVTAGPAKIANPSGTVQGGGSDTVSQERVLIVASGRGTRTTFKVANPSAYSSPALATAGFKGPLESMAPKYTLFGEVTLVAETSEKAKAALAAVREEFPWMTSSMLIRSESLPGVYSIGTRSVANAARVAEILWGTGLLVDAFVNYEQPKQSRSLLGGGSDPALFNQWHINNTINPGVDHRIQAVHDSGTTGAGVVVGVLDAFSGNITSPYDPDDLLIPGYDFSDVVHPDLFPNLNLGLSQITDPFQVGVSHETAVAGLIASVSNGSFGRGVAFGAQLASLRNGSALQTAEAWTNRINDIDITNNSWGPQNSFFPSNPDEIFVLGEDDFEVFVPGVTLRQLSSVEELALDQNLTLGRSRKGRPNVMAAGNASTFQGFPRFLVGNATSLPQFGLLDVTGSVTGTVADFDVSGAETFGWRFSGMLGDRTEYWEANSHPANLVIAAIGEDNQRAGYSTTGTAVLAAAYSEGGELSIDYAAGLGYGFFPAGRAMTTTNQFSEGADGNCPGSLQFPGLTCSFNGTSAAAPVAAGVFALMLEANPNLTIRDIEYIIQQTSVPINFNPVGGYWTNLIGFGVPDADDPATNNPLFWQANSADVLHSDEFGFGLIDAEAAVEAARTWTPVPRLRILDTGVIASESDIPDAEFVEIGPIGTDELPKTLFQMVPGEPAFAGRELPNGVVIGSMACVRENLQIEKVFVTVTVSGVGSGDLLIMLRSPNGTVSPLVLPRADSGFFTDGTEEFAYLSYTFKTYKHWGELSGGRWDLILQDYRPDGATPEGELPDEGDPMDPDDDEPGEEQVTLFGPLGIPGAEFFEHSEKALVSFQLEIHGVPVGAPPTLDCPPILTTCPGDLNGNGIVTFEDLAIFLNWYNTGNPLADINGDGLVTFEDIQSFLGIWTPGFCSSGTLGRPDPNGVADRPIIRPI